MSPLTPLVLTGAGLMGLGLQVLWAWWETRQGRGDEQAGPLGCAWLVACSALILMGGLLSLALALAP